MDNGHNNAKLKLAVDDHLTRTVNNRLDTADAPRIKDYFYLHLPLHITATPIPGAIGRTIHLSNLHLLLVRSGPLARQVAIRVLGADNTRIITINGTTRTLRALRGDRPFTTTLISFSLPSISNVALTQRLTRRCPSLILVNFDTRIVSRALHRHADSLFHKVVPGPIPHRILNRLLTRCLRLRIGGSRPLSMSRLGRSTRLVKARGVRR